MIVIMCILISSCNNSITENQAISIVKKQREQNSSHGKINIISVTHSDDYFIVNWERKSNCESGTDHISEMSGEITSGIHTIC